MLEIHVKPVDDPEISLLPYGNVRIADIFVGEDFLIEFKTSGSSQTVRVPLTEWFEAYSNFLGSIRGPREGKADYQMLLSGSRFVAEAKDGSILFEVWNDGSAQRTSMQFTESEAERIRAELALYIADLIRSKGEDPSRVLGLVMVVPSTETTG